MQTRQVTHGQGPRELLKESELKLNFHNLFAFTIRTHCLGAWMKYLLWIMEVFIRISCFKHKLPVNSPHWLQQIKTHLSLTTAANNKLTQNPTDLERRKFMCQSF